MEIFLNRVRLAAPYLVIEVLLPGGTLIAVLLYLARRYKLFSNPMSIWRAAVRLWDVTL